MLPSWITLLSSLRLPCFTHRVLVHAKRLGSAYTLAMSVPPKFAPASAPVLEAMLNEAVNAKDRRRVGVGV